MRMVVMRDDFEEIRAERERPFRNNQAGNQHSGLWKQIALGIVAGYFALGIISIIGWVIVTQLVSSGMQINPPW
jgi:hypothetical protein